MLSALLLFALGSTICGASSSLNMLIVGRGAYVVLHLLATATATAGDAGTCMYGCF